MMMIIYISILTYNNLTLTEKKKGLLSLFILERLFRLLLYVYIFSLLFFYFFFLKMDLILKKVCLIVLETNNIINFASLNEEWCNEYNEEKGKIK